MNNDIKAAVIYNASTKFEHDAFAMIVDLEDAGFENAEKARKLMIKLRVALAQLTHDTRK
jgi:hypothetical protein